MSEHYLSHAKRARKKAFRNLPESQWAMELAGVEPVSRNRPTFRPLQFSPLLVRQQVCQRSYRLLNVPVRLSGSASRLSLTVSVHLRSVRQTAKNGQRMLHRVKRTQAANA